MIWAQTGQQRRLFLIPSTLAGMYTDRHAGQVTGPYRMRGWCRSLHGTECRSTTYACTFRHTSMHAHLEHSRRSSSCASGGSHPWLAPVRLTSLVRNRQRWDTGGARQVAAARLFWLPALQLLRTSPPASRQPRRLESLALVRAQRLGCEGTGRCCPLARRAQLAGCVLHWQLAMLL